MAGNETRGDGEPPAAGDTSTGAGWLVALQRNRAFTALFAICIVAGAVAGVVYLPEELSWIRRLVGGAISGAGVAFLMTATKLM
jgi:hydrogenase/urease accessory protein HupE